MSQRMSKALVYCLLLLICSVVEDVVKSESCEVTPVSYRYRAGSLVYPDASYSSSCSSSQPSREDFLICSQSTIRNGDQGPENFSDATINDYYQWDASGGQIEFTFNQNISFTKVRIYFYVNRDPNLALPKLRLLGEDGEGFPECSAPTTSGIIDRSLDILTLQSNPSLGRHVQEMNLAGISNALLLCILPAKNYNLALTEIRFCTNDTIVVPTSSTSPTERGVSQNSTPATDSTTTPKPDVGDKLNNNIPIGLPVGVTLGVALILLVVAVVLIVIWKTRSACLHKSSDQSDSKGMITSLPT